MDKRSSAQNIFFQLIRVLPRAILVRLFGIYFGRTDPIARDPLARKIFGKCKLKHSKDGFYFVDPMPSSSDLNKYYSSTYWRSRSGKIYGVRPRDLVHYMILNEHIPQCLNDDKVFVNIGAGHGGISNLMWLKGMKVVNVEPSQLPEFYSERWRTVSEIKCIDDSSVDVIYGSHSLEHVEDINIFKVEARRILKPGGFLFFEVPNAECPTNGVQLGRVDIPHTYYFEKKFFQKWFSNIIICDGYEQSHKFHVIQNWKEYIDTKGSVIRALGQIG